MLLKVALIYLVLTASILGLLTKFKNKTIFLTNIEENLVNFVNILLTLIGKSVSGN